METIRDKTIGEIATEDYRRAAVLKRYDIEFCCCGDQTLEAACRSRGLDPEEIQRQISRIDDGFADNHLRPDKWPIDFLADYIERVHHAFIRDQMPVLRQFSRKVASVHGHQDENLYEIDALVHQLASTLANHIQTEEEVLFPKIRLLHLEKSEPASGFGSVGDLTRDLGGEHEHVGTMMRRVRELTCDYQAPEHACATYKALYAGLRLFEQDLRWHFHLENNILFPGAVEAENRLQSAQASVPAGM